jgi:CubicO group peptidase (beta-lactamase class C family)
VKKIVLTNNNPITRFQLTVVLMLQFVCAAHAGPAGENLPKSMMMSTQTMDYPVANASFLPGSDAAKADAFHAKINISQTVLTLDKVLSQPICNGQPVKVGGSCRGGYDKRVFPELTLELFTFGDNKLGSAQVGTMVAEQQSKSGRKSYWHVILQYGNVWKEPGDGGWSRASLPIMLVNNTENVAHQGVATFLYQGKRVSKLRMQFVQQSTPWNTPEHFLAWGVADINVADNNIVDSSLSGLAQKQYAAVKDISQRVDMKPLSELVAQYPAGALEGFAGSLNERWVTMKAIIKGGTVYYQSAKTPLGAFPYPEEMRFGIRSMTKSITVPLALARLAKVYGPYVLNLKIGDYVEGLPDGYKKVRFIDAANMASGMGGSGTFHTYPNDGDDGYVDATYDNWYNGARSAREKVELIHRDTGAYPWGPGVVYRYRDRDYHLLGAAMDGFLKKMQGPDSDIWTMLENDVFLPINIHHAPIVKTVETDGSAGLAWFHAGFYPTLDDIAKIAQLYLNMGSHKGKQILHPGVIAQIFSTQGALIKDHDHSLEKAFSVSTNKPDLQNKSLYKMGFHYAPYLDGQGKQNHVPMMIGFSANQVVFHPNKLISVRLTKAWPLPDEEKDKTGPEKTIKIINSLKQ